MSPRLAQLIENATTVDGKCEEFEGCPVIYPDDDADCCACDPFDFEKLLDTMENPL